MKNLTGKDLKNYRESLNISQRVFARAYDMSRDTLAGYEWSGKELPNWLVNKLLRYDPYFIGKCATIRKRDELSQIPQKRSWIVRLLWKILGY